MANNRSQLKIKINHSVVVLRFFTIVLCLCINSTLTNDDYLNCEKDGKFFACHSAPQFMDFVTNTNFTIEVEPPEYTCGNPKSSYFRLGENFGPPKTCDSSVPAQNHPVEAMVDKGDNKPSDTSTWWQSKTWPISLYETTNQFEVSIVMSFNKSFRMTGDMKIVFNSGRPTDMVLEKSSDYGQTWTPIQYYARDCEKYTNQGIAKTITKDKANAVTCTEKYSVNVFNPQPGLRVDFAAFSDRYILFFPNENYTAYYNSLEGSNLLKFLSFTNLKIRLLHPATDARETSRQASDFLRYYYAISDILIEARCFCNLHSSSCTFVNGQATCQCQHFTTGRDCEECLPMYNNKPWKPGTYSPYPTGTANQCEKCECYDHADSCVYNETVSRGVCVNCTHNTTGYSCEDCLPGFFPLDNLALNDSARCVECSCEPLGVTDTTSSCIQSSNILGAVPGQCKCKPLVTGRRCDQCDPEYYGLLTGDTPGTCKMCNCDTDGTVNGNNVCAQSDGQCVCKPSTQGRRCDTCKAGFYNFPRGNPAQNCVTCACDSGLSTNKTCDPASGVCVCKDHASGDKCTVIETNYYVPALDYFLLQPEGGQSADCMMQDDLWTPEKPFDGNEFASCPLGKDSTVNFQQIIGDKKQKDVMWSYHPTIRYTLNITEALEGVIVLRSDGASSVDVSALQTLNNVTLDNACNIAANTLVSNITITLQPGTSTGAVSVNETISLDLRCKYTLSLTITGIQNSTDSVMIDSAILIPALAVMNDANVTASFRFYEERDNKDEVMESYVNCVGKVAGLLTRDSAIKTDPCASVIRSVGGDLHDGPKLCTCDPIGTVVNTVCYNIGGQCTCKPGVGGLKCDRCLSGYFNFTVEGCLRCPMMQCPVTTTSLPPTSTPSSLPTANTTNTTAAYASIPEDSYKYHFILIGFGVGLFIMLLLILIFFCVEKRKKKYNIEDNKVPSKNTNMYEFNERLASGKSKNKQKNDINYLRDSNSLPVGRVVWNHDPESSGDLESIQEETSSTENGESPFILQPKPKLVQLAQSFRADDYDDFRKERQRRRESNNNTDNLHTFKSNTPISVPAMFADDVKTNPPDKPKRKKQPKTNNLVQTPSLRASRVNPESKTMEYVYPDDYAKPSREEVLTPSTRSQDHSKPPKPTPRKPSRASHKQTDDYNRAFNHNPPMDELLLNNVQFPYAGFGEFDEEHGSVV